MRREKTPWAIHLPTEDLRRDDRRNMPCAVPQLRCTIDLLYTLHLL